MDDKDVYAYILSEINNYRTVRVPLTSSKDWNMYEHIERCTNVANGWFHQGANDGLRPYDDLVTPIINVAFRSEGFDVKDIVPFVDSIKNHHKSFFVKKFHPKWARKNEIDTFIDEVVEQSIIYDLVIVKDSNKRRPELVDLKTIAFCDQTDVLASPLCIKYNYTPAELAEFRGKWDDDRIDQAIVMSLEEKKNPIPQGQTVKTPSKYIEVYELRGNLPESWLKEGGKPFKYTPQMKVVCFYSSSDGEKHGITLYEGRDKPLADVFKVLKIDTVRSKGRACGKSIVETLFDPQVWNNYSAIKLKQLMDSALNVFVTDSAKYKSQKLTDIKPNTVLSIEKGDSFTKVDGTLQNLTAFTNHQTKMQNDARILGSASDAQLGTNPVSGTPFALQELVVQQGQGMHEYRQGKIATFFADVLYRDWILHWLVKDMQSESEFSEELTLDEMIEISEIIASNKAERKIKDMILSGKKVTTETRDELKTMFKESFMKNGSRGFFKLIKDEIEDIPISVMVNIKGKQRYMAQNADKITNILREVMKNSQAFSTIPGLGNSFNQLLEESGLKPIDFSQITKAPEAPQSGGVKELAVA
jgi:hypothetical protein